MAASNDDGSSYSDDGLDDLDTSTLAQLEQNAIAFTQHASTQNRLAPSSDYGDVDDDLDHAVLIDKGKGTNAQANLRNASTTIGVTAYEQFRVQRYGATSSPYGAGRPNLDRDVTSGKLQSRPLGTHLAVPATRGSTARPIGSETLPDSVDELQRQIEALMSERNSLQQEVNIKNGEISIVRSKADKHAKETERELAAVKKLHLDQLAKKQQELDAVRVAEKNARTDLDFTRQDLAEEVERTRKLKRTKTIESKDALNLTPSKKKALTHRDGFDDEEVEIISPSKFASPSRLRKRDVTSPSKPGLKRKRKVAESPIIGSLDIVREADSSQKQAAVETSVGPIIDEALMLRLGSNDDRFNVPIINACTPLMLTK